MLDIMQKKSSTANLHSWALCKPKLKRQGGKQNKNLTSWALFVGVGDAAAEKREGDPVARRRCRERRVLF
ncbi:hypothetical protein ACFX13_010787 [Malus domestica]